MAPVPPSGRAEEDRQERPERSHRPLAAHPARAARTARAACTVRTARTGREEALDALLADLGASIRRGAPVLAEESRTRLPTGLPGVDQLLRGGLPLGRLSEIHGPRSSGRTSLVLSLAAGVTRTGECVAVVDRADALDPASARAAGVDLARVLWVRAPGRAEALRCAERLLGTTGFPLVVLDLGDGVEAASPATTWLRLARQAAATRTALVMLGGERLAGPHAEVSLEMQLESAHFEGAPALLEALVTRTVLVRHRSAPEGSAAPVRWRVGVAA